MSGAEEAWGSAPAAAADSAAARSGRAAPRGRLFRKYALLFVALVGVALLVNSGFDFWFSYQENKTALVRIQQEKAQAAATRIAEFVGEIERQIGWTTHAQWAAGPLDQRRQDYVRLLRQVPAITELTQLDGRGRECLTVSRLKMDVIPAAECAGADFSQSPGYLGAKATRIWFSPVYFRKQSEPYLTLAIARDGRQAGVTIAEINLKLIWDVITALKIGQGGYAYVVDRAGRLIAHPDISLVLRDTDLAALPQVAAALSDATSTPAGGEGTLNRPSSAGGEPPQNSLSPSGGEGRVRGQTPNAPAASVAQNLAGHRVLTAHAAIAPLGWLVFVEVPLGEAFAPLYGAAWRTVALLALGLVAATLVALVLARRMTGPIQAIAAGAERLGAGELGRRIEVHTGDELEALAEQFNHMAGDLQASYAELEQRVADRTAELSEALDQQTATSEVLGVINASPGDLAPVFDAVLEKATRVCDAVFGTLLGYDGEHFRNVAVRNVPPAFAEFVKLGNVIPFGPGTAPNRLLAGEQFVHVIDGQAEEAYRQAGSARALIDLGGARTWVSVALRKDDALLGAITIFRQEVRPFSDKQIALLQNFAAQAVIAMENARLITETREALEQQTATAEVLGVINSSPGDLAPVFDAMLERALSLCEAAIGALGTFDGERFSWVAARDAAKPYAESIGSSVSPLPGLPLGRIASGEKIVHIEDVVDIDDLLAASPGWRGFADSVHPRTAIWIALRKDAALLGVIVIWRQEVRPFADKQIALLQNFAAQAVIAMENARLITETREALEQQTATAEVLKIISQSGAALEPMLEAVLSTVMRLCNTDNGEIFRLDSGAYRLAVCLGNDPEYLAIEQRQVLYPNDETLVGRVALASEPVQILDAWSDPRYRPKEDAKLGGWRTMLGVPLLREGMPVGVICTARARVEPFTERQIELARTFADQAVIAMENARLITETREALEQQTATAEVLGVINSSPGDLAPVFDAMLEKATRLCDASYGIMNIHDNGLFRPVAVHGLPPAIADLWLKDAPPPGPHSSLSRVLRGEDVVQIDDLSVAPAYREGDPRARAIVDQGGARTWVTVALRNDRQLLGTIAAFRQEVRPFSDKQIALLQNFAAQAVIAMENARLITETREALEQQTATAEVLGVINSSPGDLAPVFDAMLEKAMRLCNASFGSFATFDGERFPVIAHRGVPAEFVEAFREPLLPPPGTALARIGRGEAVVQVADLREAPSYRSRSRGTVALVEIGGARSAIWVGLRKEAGLLGVLCIFRQEVRPFTDKEVALLENFAAQAVIAMENARLITETREALEQQTATAEVLGVINSSPGDLAPVFDAMLQKATRLCEARYGQLATYSADGFRGVAAVGLPMESADALSRIGHPPANTVLGRVERTRQTAQIADIAQEPSYAEVFHINPWLRQVRTALAVPLLKEGELVGTIHAFREEVRPFTSKQIALLENFAAQAVIAMENARLLGELRGRTRDLQESLEYQTATSDVLRVISQSTFDLEPVLQTVLDTAMRLCGNSQGEIFRLRDGVYRMAVASGLKPEYEAVEARQVILPGPDTLVGRTALAARPVHIVDALADPDYLPKDHARLDGARTMLGVPLLREGVPIGVICTARRHVQPFTDKEIELVSTFADQAVIAIENARLLNELRERTQDLAQSVEELKALSEVGQAVSSTLELRGVLVTILNRSVDLAGADAGAIFRYRRADRTFRFVEAVGYTEAMVREVRALEVGESATGMGIAIAQRAPLQIPDLRERPPNPLRDQAIAAGYRSVLIVPLVGADRILGATILQRRAVGEFPEATVRLMQTLAAQSVLAIQNARLFREIADKSEQLAEASRHKSQFLANMSHELRTPLNAILGYTELMVDGIYGELPARAAGVLDRVQNNGRHLLALINDVLDLSKIEAGQLVLTLEDYALADVVQSVVSATEGLASTKGLKFTANVEPGLPTGHGDARRLAQVLLNLVGNAVKFTDAGEVAVGAGAEDGRFVLTVRDTGPGIAPEDQGKIFEEFQQIDNSNTRKKGGTGLGLAISKRMVEMQGGTISVESKLGKGAAFRVSLPIRVESVADDMAGELMGAA